ncbi:MAG: HD domain-containing protein [Acholeplasmatales bacterium]|nr:HD domain-containing protein [Acholeplasmatales bacterium]
MISYDDIKKNEEINTYIKEADKSLIALGYTEHSFAHVTKVANDAAAILKHLNYNEHDIELAKIAGYMHDIGNLINRIDHSQSGAIMAFRILDHLGMEPSDIALITSAIGNHDEGTGVAVNHIAAALIIADKSDVRRSRVRNEDTTSFDIHDRVNYSVYESNLELIDNEIILNLKIDTTISPVMEYFEIFLNRMLMCKNAAKKLGLIYRLKINNQILM